jgi:hypothetical protein
VAEETDGLENGHDPESLANGASPLLSALTSKELLVPAG